MLIDVLVILLLVKAVWKGFRKGLILAMFSFFAFIIGLAAALKLSAWAAEQIGEAVNVSQRFLPVLAFLAVFFLVSLLVRLGAKLLEGVAGMVMLGWLNKLGGVFFYILLYLFIFSIILFYSVQLNILKTPESSVTFPFLYAFAPYITEAIGVVIPFFRDMFNELLQFFENVPGK